MDQMVKDNGNLFQDALKLHQDGNLAEAANTYHNILEKDPGRVDVIFLLGTLNIQQGNLELATTYLKKAISLKPDHVAACNNLGTALQSQGRLSEAVVIYNQVIELKPDYAEARINLGNVFQEQGKFDEAMVCYNRVIEFQPDYAEAHYNLGNALGKKCKPDEAASCFSKAIELKPEYVEAHNNLGSVFHKQGKLDEAASCFSKAIELKPDYTEAHINLGNVFQEQGRFDEAMVCYNLAIELKPDYAEAHMNRSFALMLTGNFEEGWPEYEWRLHTKDSISKTFQQPRWDGTPLNGKSILVHAEQGLGDTIQFVRYLPMVQSKGGHVIFECQKDLLRLLENSAGFDEIIEKATTSEENSHFDVQVPLLSLPGIFGTTFKNIPSKVPYITVDPEPVKQWSERIEHNDDFKIGIVWAGSPHHKNDRNRSCKLEDFTQLAEIPDLIFYSLQKGPASAEVNYPPKGMKTINLEDSLIDFADTAALIANLDLVISIDTSVAHLAGAIGKPVWNLLSFVPDWRWLLGRDDSPWYPDMRLFRQTRPNDWTGVFEQVKKALLYKLNTEVQRIAKPQPSLPARQAVRTGSAYLPASLLGGK